MTNVNFELIKIIYLGRRLLSNKTLGNKYITVDLWTRCLKEQDENIVIELFERLGSTFKAERSTPIIGGIYEVYCKLEKDTIASIRKSRKFIGTSNYSNKDIIAQLEIKDAAAYEDYKAEKLEKKMKGDTVIEKEMIALRAMYQKTAWQDKVVFEHMVIQSLRRRDI